VRSERAFLFAEKGGTPKIILTRAVKKTKKVKQVPGEKRKSPNLREGWGKQRNYAPYSFMKTGEGFVCSQTRRKKKPALCSRHTKRGKKITIPGVAMENSGEKKRDCSTRVGERTGKGFGRSPRNESNKQGGPFLFRNSKDWGKKRKGKAPRKTPW